MNRFAAKSPTRKSSTKGSMRSALVMGKGSTSSATKSMVTIRGRRRAATAKPTTSAAAVVRALKASRGAEALIKATPGLGTVGSWLRTASFTVCKKTGTARFLDFEGPVFIDRVWDVQRSVSECRMYFTGVWPYGIRSDRGKVACEFAVPTDGIYVCNAQLQSDSGPAEFQCYVDTFKYPSVQFEGQVNQPHPARLSAGTHNFFIERLSGNYLFVSASVWSILEAEQ